MAILWKKVVGKSLMKKKVGLGSYFKKIFYFLMANESSYLAYDLIWIFKSSIVIGLAFWWNNFGPVGSSSIGSH